MRAPSDVAAELGDSYRHRLLQKERDALLIERAKLLLSANAAQELARENTSCVPCWQLQTRPHQQMVHAALLYQGHDWFAQRITWTRERAPGCAAACRWSMQPG